MSMEYIRKYYGVPAKRGMRVTYRGRYKGTITGSRGAHIRIRMDDGPGFSRPYHPTWEISYGAES